MLVTEDQASLRLLFVATLQRAGLRVTAVDDGRAALEAARRERPALILLDVGLPGMDGLAVCRALKADPATATITVVLVTARCQPHERDAGIAAGADGYLVKPFSPAQLVVEVRRRLGAPPSTPDARTPQLAHADGTPPIGARPER